MVRRERMASLERASEGSEPSVGVDLPEPPAALARNAARSRPAEPRLERKSGAREDDPDLFVPTGRDWTNYQNTRSEQAVSDEPTVAGAPADEVGSLLSDRPARREARVEARTPPEPLPQAVPAVRQPRLPKQRPELQLAAVSAEPEPPAVKTRLEASPVTAGRADSQRPAATAKATAQPRLAERQAEAERERQRLVEEKRQQQLAEAERERDLQASVPQASNSDIFIPAEGGWTVYKNARFGTTLAFPSVVFDVLGPSQGGNGRRLKARAGDAQIEVNAWNDMTPEALQNLRRRLMDTAGYEQVTYQRRGDNWFVLSGFRGDAVFYEKYLLETNTGTIHTFSMEYPGERKNTYDTMLDQIENSFQRAIKRMAHEP
jgi:hypothetical protein